MHSDKERESLPPKARQSTGANLSAATAGADDQSNDTTIIPDGQAARQQNVYSF